MCICQSVCLSPSNQGEKRNLTPGGCTVTSSPDLQSCSSVTLRCWLPSQQVSACLGFQLLSLHGAVSRVSPADLLVSSHPQPLFASVRDGCEKPVCEGSLCVQLWVCFFHFPLSGETLVLGPHPVPEATAEVWLLSKSMKYSRA